MKNQEKYLLIRRRIIAESILLVVIITALIIFLNSNFRLGISRENLLLLILFQAPIGAIVGYFRIKDGHDKLIVQKDILQTRLNEKNKKTIRHAEKKLIRENFYFIKRVYSHRSKPYAFLIILNKPIKNNIMPEILVDGVSLMVEKDNSNFYRVICYAEKIISSEDNLITFNCCGNEYSIKNIYKHEINSDNIVWQCEGHSAEKIISIDESCFSHPHEATIYPFDLIIDGKIVANLFGHYNQTTKSIVISIKEVSKNDCLNHICLIRNNFGKKKRILLPEPKVMVRDGEVVH